jgi:hypothetical protein
VSYGIVDLSNAGAPILMLDQAQLCQDCNAITAASGGRCLRCGSQALLSLAGVLNRSTESKQSGCGCGHSDRAHLESSFECTAEGCRCMGVH